MNKKYFCIGDSHTSFFSGFDEILPLSPYSKFRYSKFEPYRLGAPLAFNIAMDNTSSKGKEKLFELLNTRIPKNSNLLLVFGEIDCRVHIIKQSKEKGQNIEDVVIETVDRYFLLIRELKDLNYDLTIWAAIPSTIFETGNKEFPTFGSIAERTEASLLFNKHLEQKCYEYNINFLSIYKYLVDLDGLMIRKYFMDEVHLSKKALPFLFKELRLPFYYSIYYLWFTIIDFLKSRYESNSLRFRNNQSIKRMFFLIKSFLKICRIKRNN